ncbi:hypothetical protein ACYFX5_16365 [Bremerella sp. T1]|uniref:hypothetical protein n=1 Tax=Bremerella sp. TYQ1 TaxID=3119568 RepID=UPI001CCA3C10|nr:hypothetical protein [Bremerella volcania]UBM34632.1 hypothetical protein LA756_18315 [Bremerella volcania]
MQINGEILPAADTAIFTRERWCKLITSRAEFKRPTPKETTNPFTGEAMTVLPPEDVAEVVFDGIVVGKVYWSMSDVPLINFSIEASNLEVVEEWATAMGGRFHVTG